jgi:hypothetical protein
VLVVIAAVLLPVSAATGARWLAAPIIVCGVLGLSLLVAAIVGERD